MTTMQPPAPLPWHDEADVLGVRVRAYFFDPAEVDARSDFASRQLPILRHGTARLLAPEGQRQSYRAGGLLAQPHPPLANIVPRSVNCARDTESPPTIPLGNFPPANTVFALINPLETSGSAHIR